MDSHDIWYPYLCPPQDELLQLWWSFTFPSGPNFEWSHTLVYGQISAKLITLYYTCYILRLWKRYLYHTGSKYRNEIVTLTHFNFRTDTKNRIEAKSVKQVSALTTLVSHTERLLVTTQKTIMSSAMYGMRLLYSRVTPLLRLTCLGLCRHLLDAASKHAAQAFFDCLRAEVQEYGIIVSTISHTFINASTPPSTEKPVPKQNSLVACE